MSTLSFSEKKVLGDCFGMSSGYVLDFSDRTFADFVGEAVEIDIHSPQYQTEGSSKAKKLRAVWKLESDHMVGTLLLALIAYASSLKGSRAPAQKTEEQCRQIVARLLSGAPVLAPLKDHAKMLDARHLAQQIRRIESSVEGDPDLAIGTAKELIETCCKTILAERGKPADDGTDVPALVKLVMKELRLVPEGVPEAAKGADTIRRLLGNLGVIGQGLAELRNLYGTGHGKHARTSGLKPRHAKLAVGAAATLTAFLLETYTQEKA